MMELFEEIRLSYFGTFRAKKYLHLPLEKTYHGSKKEGYTKGNDTGPCPQKHASNGKGNIPAHSDRLEGNFLKSV